MSKKTTLALLILFSILIIYSATSKPEYELIINYSYFIPGKSGPIKVYKKYENNTIEELKFPSDTFENVGANSEHRKSYEKSGFVLNFTPDKISWNGKYYLMDNGYSLIKYDGRRFEVYRYNEGLYSPFYHIAMLHAFGKWILVYADEGFAIRIRIFNEENLSKYSEHVISLPR